MATQNTPYESHKWLFSYSKKKQKKTEGYTTQAGSTILFFNVVSLCEIDKLLFSILIPNYCFFARDIF